jgi:hypothetical protein
MYADRSIDKEGNERDALGAFSGDWGNLVTYIPKEHVRKISIRLLSPNPFAGAEEG